MQTLIDGFLIHAPTVAFLLVIVIAGLLLARALAKLARWAVDRMGLEAFAEKLGVSRLLYASGVRIGLAQVIGKVAWWTVMGATLVVASEVAGLDGVSDAIGRVVGYLPQLLIAAVILLAGARVAEWARAMLLRSTRESGGVLDSPKSVAQIVYYAIIVVSVTFAADQLGLETALINSLILMVVAATAFGMALALALAARVSLGGVIARFYAAQLYRPGDRVQVLDADVEGVVLRYSATSMVVQIDAGDEMLVPCARVLQSVVKHERGKPVSPASPPSRPAEPGESLDQDG